MRSPVFTDPRLKREARTLRQLIRLYCRLQHQHDEVCLECMALETYALERLFHCPYQGTKPVCSRCPRHCYRERERAAIRRVMRFAGPRLVWTHPLLSLRHILDRMLNRHAPAGRGRALSLHLNRPKQE